MEESYAYQYLGKSLTEVTLADLENYFSTEKEESNTLEFKSYVEEGNADINEKKKAVHKTICAFLNSNGGLLVWGAPVGHRPPGRRTKTVVGALSPIPRLIEKDTFMTEIVNKITPIGNRIYFYTVQVNATDYIYLIDVIESAHKPHQYDDRFWVRLDGQTSKAPYYLIDALFKQVSFPNLGGYIWLGNAEFVQRNVFRFRLRVHLLNHSRYQNEEDIYFALSVSKGVLSSDDSNVAFDFDNRRAIRNDLAKVMSYSHGPYVNFSLQINYQDFADEPFQMILTFGGKKSPMKKSTYELSFHSTANYSPSRFERIENMFEVSRQLNKLMSNDNISEEERVQILLGLGA